MNLKQFKCKKVKPEKKGAFTTKRKGNYGTG